MIRSMRGSGVASVKLRRSEQPSTSRLSIGTIFDVPRQKLIHTVVVALLKCVPARRSDRGVAIGVAALFQLLKVANYDTIALFASKLGQLSSMFAGLRASSCTAVLGQPA